MSYASIWKIAKTITKDATKRRSVKIRKRVTHLNLAIKKVMLIINFKLNGWVKTLRKQGDTYIVHISVIYYISFIIAIAIAVVNINR